MVAFCTGLFGAGFVMEGRSRRGGSSALYTRAAAERPRDPSSPAVGGFSREAPLRGERIGASPAVPTTLTPAAMPTLESISAKAYRDFGCPDERPIRLTVWNNSTLAATHIEVRLEGVDAGIEFAKLGGGSHAEECVPAGASRVRVDRALFESERPRLKQVDGILCRDGWVSHAKTTRGACSHHGGISWRAE